MNCYFCHKSISGNLYIHLNEMHDKDMFNFVASKYGEELK